MVPRFGVCLHVNTLRPSFISVLRYFKQRRPNDNNMDVYVPITHSAVFPSGLGLFKKKRELKYSDTVETQHMPPQSHFPKFKSYPVSIHYKQLNKYSCHTCMLV